MKRLVLTVGLLGALLLTQRLFAQIGPASIDAIGGVQQLEKIPDNQFPDNLRDRQFGDGGDWQGRLNRLINSKYDCPQVQEAVGKRRNRLFISPKQGWDAMDEPERANCRKEGNALAVQRVATKLQAMPANLKHGLAKAALYLRARSTAHDSQCEPDFDGMQKAARELSRVNNMHVPDEEFHRDFVRIAKEGLLASLPTKVLGEGIELSVAASFGPETSVPTLLVAKGKLPDAPADTEYRDVSFTLNPDYGPGTMLVSVLMVGVTVPEIEIDPLPIDVAPISINWERKHHTNISSGNYASARGVQAGYQYCSHSLRVYSANNVCASSIEVSPRGVAVTAEIFSGSFVDKWRGWLRAEGQLVSIATNAKVCQVARAKCSRNYGTAQLIANDSWCEGRKAWERSQNQELCGREGIPGREICHYGTVNQQGRCVIEKSVPCY